MKDQNSISKKLQKIITEHEEDLRENYKKMLARYNILKKKIST